MPVRQALLFLLAGLSLAGCGSTSSCPSLGSHLPRDFAECSGQGFSVVSAGGGARTCTGMWKDGSEAFAECRAAGGGWIAGEGQPDSCKIVYLEGACACTGNACD